MQTRICKQFDFHRITKQKLRFPIKFGVKKTAFSDGIRKTGMAFHKIRIFVVSN